MTEEKKQQEKANEHPSKKPTKQSTEEPKKLDKTSSKSKSSPKEVVDVQDTPKPQEQHIDKPVQEEKTEKVVKKPDTPQTETKEKPAKIEPKAMKSQPEQKQTKKQEKEKKPEKEDKKKKEEHDEDFLYIVRIANTDIDGEKKVLHGLTQIRGVGRHWSALIVETAGIDPHLKMGKLNEQQIEKIRSVLENLSDIAPGWMLNHQKDFDTGEDLHLISSDIELKNRDDINLMKMIRSYRGIRHESNLPVRGQRTRANNRRGLSLGVSKKSPKQ